MGELEDLREYKKKKQEGWRKWYKNPRNKIKHREASRKSYHKRMKKLLWERKNEPIPESPPSEKYPLDQEKLEAPKRVVKSDEVPFSWPPTDAVF